MVGEMTHHHDHAMAPVSFRTTKINVRILRKDMCSFLTMMNFDDWLTIHDDLQLLVRPHFHVACRAGVDADIHAFPLHGVGTMCMPVEVP